MVETTCQFMALPEQASIGIGVRPDDSITEAVQPLVTTHDSNAKLREARGSRSLIYMLATSLLLSFTVCCCLLTWRRADTLMLNVSSEEPMQLFSKVSPTYKGASAMRSYASLRGALALSQLQAKPQRINVVIHASSWDDAGTALRGAGDDMMAAAALIGEDQVSEDQVTDQGGQIFERSRTALSAVGRALRNAGTALSNGQEALNDAAVQLSAAGAAAEPTAIAGAAQGFKGAAAALHAATDALDGEENKIEPCGLDAIELRAEAEDSVQASTSGLKDAAAISFHAAVWRRL
eukprot:gnl/TRDRNA2_/TRDRNA2_157579_c0_seq3.p1 gnl/TRDRNA2_/TRDRNA2_157579_c0~~gnl/TRDRNA2_/TRDRNA2_157579_c0_seq3.p1  ORF type:complete len:293 (-),score=49.37 gnl/TRDRNA2_/TRDRNA2_157579_c0_seq3:16-894(-)